MIFTRPLSLLTGRDGMTLFGQRSTPKKRRKSRTAFTNHQIYELEKRFLYQKYLSPADRDQIAQQLGLTNAQVITWFQNRRAKLKRDLEEMKADVESAKAIGQVPLEKLAKLADLEKCANGTLGHPRAHSPTRGGKQALQLVQKLRNSPLSPFSDHTTSKECSEDEGEDVEIDVDDWWRSVGSKVEKHTKKTITKKFLHRGLVTYCLYCIPYLRTCTKM